jgi:LysR family transcriptional regulator, chromosome initiation inhibitor
MKTSSGYSGCISIAHVTIDLPQLRALAAVVDEGSFDAAARALHITPSAVSQRIKALEQAAGQVLVRRSKPAVATRAGQTYVLLARQIDSLVHDARLTVAPDEAGPVTVPLAVNADSLGTWVLPALAGLAGRISFDLHREDQAHSAELLRSGTVMAAITSDAEPVQGCRSTRLGAMRYRPMASPKLVERWLPHGPDAESLAAAPVVVFDRKDDLQDRYLRQVTRRSLSPPRHHVPASGPFLEAVVHGYGWGMLPDLQTAELEADGRLVDLDPGRHVDVVLHWQAWKLRTPALEALSDAIGRAAAEHLRPS